MHTILSANLPLFHYVKLVLAKMKFCLKISFQAITIMEVITLVARKRVMLLLPIIISDLLFDECLVAELRFGRKQIFFTVLYRNPKHKAYSIEFLNSMERFRDSALKDLKGKNIINFYWRLQRSFSAMVD